MHKRVWLEKLEEKVRLEDLDVEGGSRVEGLNGFS
jgi:hypothetical protein